MRETKLSLFLDNMKTRIIHTKIWKDDFFSTLTPTEKLLFIYYLTNERVNIIHCYEITDREITFDTGIDRGIIEAFKDKVGGKIAFKDNYIFLLNANRYESYKGSLNETAKEKLLKELPKSILDWYKSILNRGIDTPLKGTINKKSEIRNKKSEIIYEKTKKYLTNFPIEDFSDIDATEKQIRLEAEKALNWLVANNKKKANYKAFLRNWVLKIYKKKISQKDEPVYEYDVEGIARLKKMKEGFVVKGM